MIAFSKFRFDYTFDCNEETKQQLKRSTLPFSIVSMETRKWIREQKFLNKIRKTEKKALFHETTTN